MIVIDTETTGLGEADQVIEFAAVWPGGHSHFLVRPTVPVNPEARAQHHITDRALAGATDAPGWQPHLEGPLAEHGTPAFHNAEFDMRLITQTWPEIAFAPHICTYRCALHLWPDAPSHSNQVLRYWLGLDVDADLMRLPPHRALPDAAVTYAILERMITERSEAELIALTQAPVVLHRVRFGKHVGQAWSEVPHDYLRWILKQNFDRDVLHTALHYLEAPHA